MVRWAQHLPPQHCLAPVYLGRLVVRLRADVNGVIIRMLPVSVFQIRKRAPLGRQEMLLASVLQRQDVLTAVYHRVILLQDVLMVVYHHVTRPHDVLTEVCRPAAIILALTPTM